MAKTKFSIVSEFLPEYDTFVPKWEPLSISLPSKTKFHVRLPWSFYGARDCIAFLYHFEGSWQDDNGMFERMLFF